MDRVTQRLWRGVEEPVPSVAEGTSALLIYPCCSEFFNHRSTHRANPPPAFPISRTFSGTDGISPNAGEPVLTFV
jgi:hypothetical protein